MKKLIFIAFLMLSYATIIAQSNLLAGGDISTRLRIAIEAYKEEPSKENKKKVKVLIDMAVDAGLNISSIVGESESYNGMLPGISLGIRTSITRPDRHFVGDLGINFTASGGAYDDYQYEPGGGGSSSKSKLRLNYLNVPLTVKYRKNIDKGFYGEAGLQPGFLLSAKDKRDGKSSDVKEGFKKFDLGVVLGAGYQVNHRIGAGVRVVPGITNINKEGNYSLKDRNLGISLRASYRMF